MTQAATMNTGFHPARRARDDRRGAAALSLGWAAYGVFYATVVGGLLAPVALALRLLGIWPG